MRLLILPAEPIKYTNAILYYINYNVIGWAGSTAFILLFLLAHPKIKKQNRKLKIAVLAPIAVGVTTLEISMILLGVPDYLGMILFVPIATAFYLIQLRPKPNLSRRRLTLYLALLVTTGSLLPPTTAYLCYSNIRSQASSKTDFGIASYVSNFVADTNFNSPSFLSSVTVSLRFNVNFQKYLMTGVGACGEMAMSTSTFLNALGLDSHIVVFPGEDHAFAEVYMNNTWFVLDPGYNKGQIITREQRANNRITEMGALSYVIAYENSSFLELTQYYVATDTIVIRVLNESLPVSHSSVFLEHTFMGASKRLPDLNQFFYSDSNGTVSLQLGKLNFNSNAGETDSFYRIYVNGILTKYIATSTGSNSSQLIEIDLAEIT